MENFIQLDQVIFGNTVARWAISVAVFVAAIIGLRLLSLLVLHRLTALAGRTHTDLDDLVVELLHKTKVLFILLVALSLAASTLVLSPGLTDALVKVLVVGLLLQGAFWGTTVITYLIGRYHHHQVALDPGGATALGAMSFIARTLVWAVVLLLALDNLGIDVTALITGLGIGGIAVALALQNVLSDLFASLSIVIDKPFVVGDFIIVGDLLGSVEYVGLKTTRIRSLSGEQLIFSNSDLLGSRIRNFKRMSERRAVFQIGVTYDTPLEKLRTIPTIIRETVEMQDNTRFDRSHLKAYGAFSLDFETVYIVLVPDYNSYMDIQHRINLEVFRRFQEEGIEFAYPTQTVFVHPASAVTPWDADESL